MRETDFGDWMLALTLLTMLCLLGGIIMSFACSAPDKGKLWRNKGKALSAIIPLWLTSWLWLPWVFHGMRNLYRWNMGNINDLEPQEKVLAPEERVRKSKADEGLGIKEEQEQEESTEVENVP